MVYRELLLAHRVRQI